ncbi:Ger(x)C family spore germination protein [Clostridium sp. WILCCON 0269]|uniref:Ger(X)C family spore germination protein n=1 Tax=Candidatus Clostridium eludens TaxID=3381663 RepID=A0ABW8SGT2_9CLOT
MRKIICYLITAILVMILCSGCYRDVVELEEQGYVSAVGIDKGKNNNLSITYQIANVKYGMGSKNGGGSANQQKNENITFESPDLITARDMANVVVARRVTLAHARILIVGESFAKTPEFFHVLEAALRDKEFRRSMSIFVCREKASEFLNKNDPKLEDRTNKYFDFVINRWKDTGFITISDLNRFSQRTEENASLFLGVYTTTKRYSSNDDGNEADYLPGQVDFKGGNPTQMIGAAVFKKGKMIGTLTGNENRFVVLLRPKNEVKSMLFTFEDPLDRTYKISARLIKSKDTKIKVDVSSNKPRINVVVPVKVEILAIPSFVKYVQVKDNEQLLKNAIKSQLEEKAGNLVKKTQEVFGGEPFLWELEVRKKFWTFEEYKKYNWMDKYTKAEVSINFDVTIKSFGKQLNPPQKLQED